MKRCPRCSDEKPFQSFGRNAGTKDGYSRWCKACTCTSNRASYLKRHPGAITRAEIIGRNNGSEKTCIGCGLSKPLGLFYNVASSADGKDGRCKECRKSLKRLEYEKHREKYIERSSKSAWRFSERAKELTKQRKATAFYKEKQKQLNNAHKDANKVYFSERARKRCADLHPAYVRGLLRSSGIADPSDELVDLKSAQMAILRLSKQLINAALSAAKEENETVSDND